VVDSEYLNAAESYKDAARKAHEATEYFKRTVVKLFFCRAITGKTAQNMILFNSEMSAALKATFKEQISLEASLCNEYLNRIDKADKSKSFSPSTKGVQSMSFYKAVETPYPEGVIRLDKAAVQQCVEQLKDGPVKDIESNIGLIERISFTESMGAVKDQNEIVRDKTVESLKALLGIFNVFIKTIESVAAAMQDTDLSIANAIKNTPFTPGFPK